MEYKYQILQMKEESEYAYDRFLSYDDLLKFSGHEPDPAAYKCMYKGTTEENTDKDTDAVLNDIYAEFNIYLPAVFCGHSLSVSDVIILENDGECAAYYVEPIGFRRLDGRFAETFCRRQVRSIQ